MDGLENSDEEVTILQSISPPQPNTPPAFNRRDITENYETEHVKPENTVSSPRGTLGHKCGEPLTMREELTNIAILSVLYVMLSSDWFWALIVRMSPRLNTWYYKVAITTTLFILLTFLLTNLKFIKK